MLTQPFIVSSLSSYHHDSPAPVIKASHCDMFIQDALSEDPRGTGNRNKMYFTFLVEHSYQMVKYALNISHRSNVSGVFS